MSIIYPFDPTGVLPANSIVNESHTPQNGNGIDPFLIVPSAAPFYGNTMSVVDDNGMTLVESRDYYLAHHWEQGTRHTGMPVYGSVILLGAFSVRTVSLNYQTIGGTYANTRNAVIQQGIVALDTTLAIDWDTAPTSFPPTEHNHELDGISGMSEVLQAIENISAAVLTPPENVNVEDINGFDTAFTEPLLLKLTELAEAIRTRPADTIDYYALVEELNLKVLAINTFIEDPFLTVDLLPRETRPGIAEIATQTEANLGTDDIRYITPLKLKRIRTALEGLIAAAQAQADLGVANAAVAQQTAEAAQGTADTAVTLSNTALANNAVNLTLANVAQSTADTAVILGNKGIADAGIAHALASTKLDATAKAVDSERVDGYDGNLIVRDMAVATNPLTVSTSGWYTVAVVGSGRAVGRIGLSIIASGVHQNVVLYAGHVYGADSSNTLSVLVNSRYNSWVFTDVRIKDGGTYEGGVLQVHVTTSTPSTLTAYLLGDNFAQPGWKLVDFIPDATDPGTVVNYASMGTRTQIDLNLVANGQAVAGPLYAGNGLVQYEVLHKGSLNIDRYVPKSGTVMDANAVLKFPNTAWGSTLTVGGGNTDGTNAAIFTTNGNLHLEPKDGHELYLNFYTGNNVSIGNGNAAYNVRFTQAGQLHFLFGGTNVANSSNNGIVWNVNSDYANIKFYNTGDADTNSRLEFSVGDNGNEYFRWVGSGTEWLSLRGDGLHLKAGSSLFGNVTGNVTGNLQGNVTGSSTSIKYLGVRASLADGAASPNGVELHGVYGNGYPTAYGNVLTLGGGGSGELLIGWSGNTAGHADNYIRSRRDVGNTWSPWATIITSANIASFAPTPNLSTVDADKLDGYHGSVANVVSTYPLRDGIGDIFVRLVRSNYPNDLTMMGTTLTSAIAFRINNSSTNDYVRFAPPSSFGVWFYGNHIKAYDSDRLGGALASSYLQTNSVIDSTVNASTGSPVSAAAVKRLNDTKLDKLGKAFDTSLLMGVSGVNYARTNVAVVTFNGGASTQLTVTSADPGFPIIKAHGTVNGNGMLYVGKNDTYGGGFYYKGADDYLTIFNKENGIDYWTARNHVTTGDWEFRKNVHVDTLDITTLPISPPLPNPEFLYTDSGTNRVRRCDINDIRTLLKLPPLTQKTAGASTIYNTYTAIDQWHGAISVGHSVSISGDGKTYAIGVPWSEGVPGAHSGAVVVVTESPFGIWTKGHTMDALNPAVGHHSILGWDVALSRDGVMLIAGAPGATSNNTVVNGQVRAVSFSKDADNTITGTTGAATFLPTTTKIYGFFGSSIAISGDGKTMIFAHPLGSRFSNDVPYIGGERVGSVEVYKYIIDGATNVGSWVKNSSLDISVDYSFYMNKSGGAVSINGDGTVIAINDVGVPEQGKYGEVAIYKLNPATNVYDLFQRIKEPQPQPASVFGKSVSVSGTGDTVVIGAPGRIVNGTLNMGIAYVFSTHNSTTGDYVLEGELLGDVKGSAQQGWDVAINYPGRSIIVGAPGDTSLSLKGDENGSFFVYDWNFAGNRWGYSYKMESSDEGSRLGTSVAISDSGDRFIGGAPGSIARFGTAPGFATIVERRV